MQKPQGIIFDLGNTLIERSFYSPVEGISSILKYTQKPINITAEQVQQIAEEVKEYLHHYREEQHIEFNCQEFHRIVFDKLNVSFSKNFMEIETIYHDASNKYTIIDGAIELLSFLEESNIKLGLLSNSIFSRETIYTALVDLKLHKYFTFIITSADYGFRKPHKLIFEQAIQQMQLPSNEIWYVGDDIENDIKGASNVNLQTILLDKNMEFDEIVGDSIKIYKLRELIEIIKNAPQ